MPGDSSLSPDVPAIEIVDVAVPIADLPVSLTKESISVGNGVASDLLSSAPFIPGLLNFRTQGALEGLDGHRLRPHLLARSDDSSRILDEGVPAIEAWLKDVGAERVTFIELRDQHEFSGDLGPVARLQDTGQLKFRRRPVEDGPRKYGSDRNAAYPGVGNGLMYAAMHLMLDDNLGGAVFSATHPGNLPNKINCASGKDRTQLVSGLSLALAGVSDAHIVNDYVKTNENNPKLLAHHGAKLRQAAEQLEASGNFFEADAKRREAAFRESPEALAQTAATADEIKTYIVMATVAARPRVEGESSIAAIARTSAELESNLASNEHVPSMLAPIARTAIERAVHTRWPKLAMAQVVELADRHIERFRETVLDGYVSPKLEARRQAKAEALATR